MGLTTGRAEGNEDPLQLWRMLRFHSFAVLDLPVKMGRQQPV